MSGHSKWSTIKHQKAVADQKRGKIFSKIARAITVAVREGKSDDPNFNPRLRLAIEQAKQINMPKENIKRAIERGMGKGEGGGTLETVLYEGFGPEKISLVIECITENKNRTSAAIKSFLERAGGSLGGPGSTSYLFEKKGFILVEKKEGDIQEAILKLIDCGAEDVEEGEGLIEVYTLPHELEVVKQRILEAGFVIKETSLVLKPKTLITIADEEKKRKILNFLENLDDLEEVQKIYCNADFVD